MTAVSSEKKFNVLFTKSSAVNESILNVDTRYLKWWFNYFDSVWVWVQIIMMQKWNWEGKCREIKKQRDAKVLIPLIAAFIVIHPGYGVNIVKIPTLLDLLLCVRYFQSIEMYTDAVAAVVTIVVTACLANFDYELFRFTYLPVITDDCCHWCVHIVLMNTPRIEAKCKVYIKYIRWKPNSE